MGGLILRTVGVAVIEALAANGIDTIFGIPGTHNIELYRGMQTTGMRHILVRHEQGAAYAADGYARSSGRPGVFVVTSGPGITNTLTGLANAYSDSIPLLAISPGPPLGMERQDLGFLHEMKDQRAAIDQIVQESIRVESAEHAVGAIHEQFLRWGGDRNRPIHIEIPYDLLSRGYDGDSEIPHASPVRYEVVPDGLERILDVLQESERPLVVLGGGALDDEDLIEQFVESLDAPTVTTTSGKGGLSEFNSLSLGATFMKDAISEVISQCDVVVALGSELSTPGAFEGFRGRLVRVDLDSAQLNKNVRADHSVLLSVQVFLAAILKRLQFRARAGKERAEEFRSILNTRTGRVDEEWLLRLNSALMEGLPGNTIVTGDSSQVSYLGTRYAWKQARSRQFITTDAFSTLGYALPAAIGAKLANPDKPVVALMGDGAAMFSIQELATAAQEKLSLPIVVVDNGAYSEIRTNMKDAQMQPMGVDLASPNFPILAKGMGCRGVQAYSIDEVVDYVAEALRCKGPTLISIRI